MQNVIISITAILDRIKSLTDAKNDADIARLLGVPPKKLAVWKLRNTIPYEEVITFCRHKGYSLEWVLTGEGNSTPSSTTCDGNEVFIRAGYTPGEPEPFVLIDEPEANIHPEVAVKIINDLLNLMTPGQKRDVLRYVEERKLISDLIRERKLRQHGSGHHRNKKE